MSEQIISWARIFGTKLLSFNFFGTRTSKTKNSRLEFSNLCSNSFSLPYPPWSGNDDWSLMQICINLKLLDFSTISKEILGFFVNNQAGSLKIRRYMPVFYLKLNQIPIFAKFWNPEILLSFWDFEYALLTLFFTVAGGNACLPLITLITHKPVAVIGKRNLGLILPRFNFGGPQKY